jgi:hypothetical protein
LYVPNAYACKKSDKVMKSGANYSVDMHQQSVVRWDA